MRMGCEVWMLGLQGLPTGAAGDRNWNGTVDTINKRLQMKKADHSKSKNFLQSTEEDFIASYRRSEG